MTHDQKLQAVKEWIIKACNLKQLKSGCRFKIIDQGTAESAPEWEDGEIFIALRVRPGDASCDGYCTAYREKGMEFVYHPDQPSDEFIFSEGHIEVIDSPIGLPEVLRAKRSLGRTDGSYVERRILNLWKLEESSIDRQSSQLIDFLHNLIS